MRVQQRSQIHLKWWKLWKFLTVSISIKAHSDQSISTVSIIVRWSMMRLWRGTQTYWKKLIVTKGYIVTIWRGRYAEHHVFFYLYFRCQNEKGLDRHRCRDGWPIAVLTAVNNSKQKSTKKQKLKIIYQSSQVESIDPKGTIQIK